jgi:hypothetical protein
MVLATLYTSPVLAAGDLYPFVPCLTVGHVANPLSLHVAALLSIGNPTAIDRQDPDLPESLFVSRLPLPIVMAQPWCWRHLQVCSYRCTHPDMESSQAAGRRPAVACSYLHTTGKAQSSVSVNLAALLHRVKCHVELGSKGPSAGNQSSRNPVLLCAIGSDSRSLNTGHSRYHASKLQGCLLPLTVYEYNYTIDGAKDIVHQILRIRAHNQYHSKGEAF